MTADRGAMVYLYGIVPADAPAPEGLAGVDDRPVRLVAAGAVAGIVSDVPAADFSAERLDARLAELDWVGRRGVEHERVLTWFADRGAVIPLAPFSLHADEARVRARLEELREKALAALARLAGRREWGVRVWRSSAARERLGRSSDRIAAMDAEIAAAAPGRRYLLQRKRDASVTEEIRVVTAEVAREAMEAPGAHAAASARLPIATPPRDAERVLVLHAAFLVDEAAFPAFQDAVSRLAARLEEIGFACDFTGPWPPYHFVDG